MLRSASITDWFQVEAAMTGTIEMTVEAGEAVYIFKLTGGSTLDCSIVAVELQAIADCDAPATLSFPVTAGETVWLWVGPTVFGPPLAEWQYYMYVSNNIYDVVPTEDMSFGGVKALFR